MAKILIIEDDMAIIRLLTVAMKANDYEPIIAKTGIDGISKCLKEKPDLVLLDMGLPDIDGSEVLAQIKTATNLPIIIVSARDIEVEKIKALDEGAIDYVTKPFNISELLARIRVAFRRVNKEEAKEIFNLDYLYVDFKKHQVKIDNEEIHLTPIEFKILKLLIDNKGKVLTHAYINKEIWGYTSHDDYQTLRVFMGTLRRKIEKNPTKPRFIVTENGVGYRMKDE